MSRVAGVIGNAIKVDMRDVVPGDVISVSDTERDPIVQEVVINENGQVKFLYKPKLFGAQETLWMEPEKQPFVFIHDLRRERFEYLEENHV